MTPLPVPVDLSAKAPMGIVCSWCEGVIREGTEPYSHTICLRCAAAFHRTAK